jgi:hypothetical protein
MRAFVVILLSSVVNNAPGFLDRSKEPAIQAPIANDAIEALMMAILPWTARRHAVGLNMLLAQPGSNPLRNELWAIITFHLYRSATWGQQPLQHPDDIAGGDRPSTVDGHALTCVFIQYCQALQPPPIRRLIVDKIIAPHMVRVRCSGRHDRADADRSPLVRFLDHLEAGALSEAAHRLATHGPLCSLQQSKDLAIPKARILF